MKHHTATMNDVEKCINKQHVQRLQQFWLYPGIAPLGDYSQIYIKSIQLIQYDLEKAALLYISSE